MGRQPCCEKVGLKKGPWSVEEDRKLVSFITSYGHSCWREVPKLAGLLRCGKSCRLRWTNYLRPDLKRGQLSDAEEKLIIDLHAAIGNRWSRIAAQLPGRTDNEIKNYWNTRIKKKLKHMGIDPVTHKPLSEITSSDSMHQKRKSNKLIINNNNIHNTTSHKGPLKSEVGYNQEDTSTVDSCISKDTIVLSKKEKLELESREAHMRVQKMKEALYAFNSRFSHSPSTFISSPTSVITLAHKTNFEDLDESLFCEKPVVARDTSIDNFLSPRSSSSIVSHHKLGAPFFPFSHVAQEARPLSSYSNNNILGEINCGLYDKHFLDRNQEENNHLHDQRRPLDKFAFDSQQPLLNDWLKAQRDSAIEISQEEIHVQASEWSPSAPHHIMNTTAPTQEASSCPWIKVSLGLQDHKPSLEGYILSTATMHVPSQESPFTSSSTFSLPPSSCLDASSSWNSMMQQFLEDSSIPCGILDSQVMTTTGVASSTSGLANFAASSISGLNNFAPSELQRLALLLDEI